MVAPCPPLETVVWHDLFLGRPRSRRYPKFNIRRDIPYISPTVNSASTTTTTSWASDWQNRTRPTTTASGPCSSCAGATARDGTISQSATDSRVGVGRLAATATSRRGGQSEKGRHKDATFFHSCMGRRARHGPLGRPHSDPDIVAGLGGCPRISLLPVRRGRLSRFPGARSG